MFPKKIKATQTGLALGLVLATAAISTPQALSIAATHTAIRDVWAPLNGAGWDGRSPDTRDAAIAARFSNSR